MKKILASLLALLIMAPIALAETGVRWIDGGNAEIGRASCRERV